LRYFLLVLGAFTSPFSHLFPIFPPWLTWPLVQLSSSDLLGQCEELPFSELDRPQTPWAFQLGVQELQELQVLFNQFNFYFLFNLLV